MKSYNSAELRSMFQQFFKDHGHAVISSASVIPENDPTVLFTTAGMHPLVPYLQGQKHPAGTRLTDVQKCIRTGEKLPSHIDQFVITSKMMQAMYDSSEMDKEIDLR